MPGERFWLNGYFVSERDAKISLLDRGLLMGDAIYEVVRFYRYRPFLLERHLIRLFAEASELEMPVLYGKEELAAAVLGLIARSEYKDGTIYLQWTRGEGERLLTPGPDRKPNLFAVRSPLVRPPARFRREGAPAITLPDERWQKTRLKTTNLLGSVLARKKAAAEGAFEAILYRGRGARARVTEGTSTTIFLVSFGTLITPRIWGLLPGITREVVLEIAAGQGMAVEERNVSLGDLRAAHEAFFTATTLEILPIASVDGQKLRHRPPGRVTSSLVRAFQIYRNRFLRQITPLH